MTKKVALEKINNGTIMMKIQLGDNLSQSERLALLSPEELQLKMKTERDLFYEYLGFLQLPENEVANKATLSDKFNNEFIKVLSLTHREITSKEVIIDHVMSIKRLTANLFGVIMKHGIVEGFNNYKIEQANKWKNYNCNCKKCNS